MDLEQLKSLVRDMRTAQKEYFKTRSHDALQRSKALEKRVDEEVAKKPVVTDSDVIIMANGQKLVQGSLFE